MLCSNKSKRASWDDIANSVKAVELQKKGNNLHLMNLGLRTSNGHVVDGQIMDNNVRT